MQEVRSKKCAEVSSIMQEMHSYVQKVSGILQEVCRSIQEVCRYIKNCAVLFEKCAVLLKKCTVIFKNCAVILKKYIVWCKKSSVSLQGHRKFPFLLSRLMKWFIECETYGRVQNPDPAICRCCARFFWRILLNSQKYTCFGVSFLTRLQVNFGKILWATFLHNTYGRLLLKMKDCAF